MKRQSTLLGLALGLGSVASAQVTNDFESGWDQTAWPIYAPDCNQGGTVTLDSTTAHSGKNSIRVDGAGGYCGHAFFGTKQVPTGDLYVRAWMKASKDLNDNHVTFIVMPDPAEGTNKHLRIGGMMKVLLYNRESDDATLPELSPQGVASSVGLPAGTWQCFEYHVGPDGTLETWVNDAYVPGLSIGPNIANPNANAWSRSSVIPKPTGVFFGWESYGNDANTFWYDDIAIGSSRIGCGSGSVSSASSASSTKTTLVTSTTKTSAVSTSSTTTKTTTISEGTTKWSTSSATSTKTTSTTSTTTASGCVATHWGQCDGIGYTGCKTCEAPYTCKYNNDWYSQCL